MWICARSLDNRAGTITGTTWSGPRFFGLRAGVNRLKDMEREPAGSQARTPNADRLHHHGGNVSTFGCQLSARRGTQPPIGGDAPMTAQDIPSIFRTPRFWWWRCRRLGMARARSSRLRGHEPY
jgi:hypothetical protein